MFIYTQFIDQFPVGCQLSWQSIAPVSHRSWVQIPYRPESFLQALFHSCLNKQCSSLQRLLSYSELSLHVELVIVLLNAIFSLYLPGNYIVQLTKIKILHLVSIMKVVFGSLFCIILCFWIGCQLSISQNTPSISFSLEGCIEVACVAVGLLFWGRRELQTASNVGQLRSQERPRESNFFPKTQRTDLSVTLPWTFPSRVQNNKHWFSASSILVGVRVLMSNFGAFC